MLLAFNFRARNPSKASVRKLISNNHLKMSMRCSINAKMKNGNTATLKNVMAFTNLTGRLAFTSR
jgi:hypothetical protein